jgi:hypothetical protein
MRLLILLTLLFIVTIPTAQADCPPFSLLDRELPTARVGTAYGNSLPVLGGVSPVTFLLTEGQLPSGISLDTTGNLLGTPRGSGEYRFTVFATDSCTSGRQQANQRYRLAVAKPGETAPVSSSRQLPPLKVSVTLLAPPVAVPVTAPIVTLRYRLSATPAETAVLESPGQSFLVDGAVSASLAAPLDAVLINGVAELTEQVTIPLAAVRSAQRGSGKIIVNRVFSGRGTSVAVVVEVPLKQ